MNILLIIIQIAVFILLIVGLVDPNLVVFWSKNKTRKKMLAVYLTLFFAVFILIGILNGEKKTGKEKSDYFKGFIQFEARATGTNKNGADLFNSMTASVYKVWFSDTMYCQMENKGMNTGRVVLNRNTMKGYFIDGYTQTAEPISAVDMDAIDERSRRFAPQFYNLKLDNTGETETICGYAVKKFKIVKGGAIRQNATAYIWVTDVFTLPPSRFMFENDTKKFPVPVPMFTGIEHGTVLKMVVDENNVVVEFIVTAIDTVIDPSVFSVPDSNLSDTLPQLSYQPY